MTSGSNANGKNFLIGLDTNVLLRFILQDDAEQSKVAVQFMNQLTPREPAFLSMLALCEFVWVLARLHRRSRGEIAGVVELLLTMAVVQIEQADLVREALGYFRASRADFADCCIALVGREAGCRQTLTFDQAASKLPGMRPLS